MAQAARATDLTDDQKDCLVSRTIIDKKSDTITFFAFDEEQELSENTASFDALLHLIDAEAEITKIAPGSPTPCGWGDVTISGKPLQVKEGGLLVMPANQPHALKVVKKFEMILTMIRS